MLRQLAFTVYALSASMPSTASTQQYSPKDLNSNFDITPKGVDKLLSKAQPLNTNQRSLDQYYNGGGNNNANNGGNGNSQISKYSIQFQGCHHIKQWNNDADGDEDVRLQTKRLARFRLVPTDKCHVVSPWASAKVIRDAAAIFGRVDYGEYIVDLNTFVASYLEAKQDECANGGDDGCGNNGDDQNGGIDIYDYAGCAQFNWQTDDDGDDANGGNDVGYYFGPSCVSQGGEIKMNLFTDDTCSELAQCGKNGKTRGATCYTQKTGVILPGTKNSIIEEPCIPCTENYLTLQQNIESSGEEGYDYSYFDYGYARDICTNLYDVSGKCEKNMKNGQYNNGCKYLEGIQIGVSSEGYAVAVRRSLIADGFIFVMLIGSGIVFLYVTYLKSLLTKKR